MSMTELLESELVQVSGGAENTLRSGPGKQGNDNQGPDGFANDDMADSNVDEAHEPYVPASGEGDFDSGDQDTPLL